MRGIFLAIERIVLNRTIPLNKIKSC